MSVVILIMLSFSLLANNDFYWRIIRMVKFCRDCMATMYCSFVTLV